jgi:hypothetical protein
MTRSHFGTDPRNSISSEVSRKSNSTSSYRRLTESSNGQQFIRLRPDHRIAQRGSAFGASVKSSPRISASARATSPIPIAPIALPAGRNGFQPQTDPDDHWWIPTGPVLRFPTATTPSRMNLPRLKATPSFRTATKRYRRSNAQ